LSSFYGGNCKQVYKPDDNAIKSFTQYWYDSVGFEVHNKYFLDDQCTDTDANTAGDEIIYAASACDGYNLAVKSATEQPKQYGVVSAGFLGTSCPNKDKDISFENAMFTQTVFPLEKCVADEQHGVSYYPTDCYTKSDGIVKGSVYFYPKSTRCTGKSRLYNDVKVVGPGEACYHMDGDYSFWYTTCVTKPLYPPIVY
jgi:hypothetical protein